MDPVLPHRLLSEKRLPRTRGDGPPARELRIVLDQGSPAPPGLDPRPPNSLSTPLRAPPPPRAGPAAAAPPPHGPAASPPPAGKAVCPPQRPPRPTAPHTRS